MVICVEQGENELHMVQLMPLLPRHPIDCGTGIPPVTMLRYRHPSANANPDANPAQLY